MRTELFFGKEVPEARKAEVRAAFGQRGLAIAREGPAALKSLEILDVRIDAAFIVGAAIGGALWEAEKELLDGELRLALRLASQRDGDRRCSQRTP